MSAQKDTITIDGITYTRAGSPPASGDLVIARGSGSGVHVGTLESQDGSTVVLRNVSRIWRWYGDGINTLSELANHGPDRTKTTRISERVDKNTKLDCCELVFVADAAVDKFDPIWL